jgi:AraC-like DNA-binding protein
MSFACPAASIQRDLAEHGMTYKDAVELTRRSLASAYLDQRQMPLTEIALLLGYSELSAFTRAFHALDRRQPQRSTAGAATKGRRRLRA